MGAVAAVINPPTRSKGFPGPRRAINRLSPLTQALDLKDLAYHKAKASDTPVHIAAALMRAWADLHEITMAIRGQGKPKPVEARNATPKRKRVETAPLVYPTPGASAVTPPVSERKAG